MAKQIKGVLGEKLGMTQVFDGANRVVPVTVVKAGPCVVTQVRTVAKDGYSAVQLAFGAIDPRKVNKPETGHFSKAGLTPRRASPPAPTPARPPAPRSGRRLRPGLVHRPHAPASRAGVRALSLPARDQATPQPSPEARLRPSSPARGRRDGRAHQRDPLLERKLSCDQARQGAGDRSGHLR